MRRFFVCVYAFFGFCSLFYFVSFSQNLSDVSDKFYDGLASIIERNMDDPVNCVREIDKYYQDNQALIQKIRLEMAQAMQKAAPMMKEYMKTMDSRMIGADFDENGLDEFKGKISSSENQSLSPAAARYSKAIEAFSARHPQYAMRVAVRAMELLPEMQLPASEMKPE